MKKNDKKNNAERIKKKMSVICSEFRDIHVNDNIPNIGKLMRFASVK